MWRANLKGLLPEKMEKSAKNLRLPQPFKEYLSSDTLSARSISVDSPFNVTEDFSIVSEPMAGNNGVP